MAQERGSMKKFDPFKNLKLDPEEQAILDAYERGEFRPVKNMDKVIKQIRQAWQYTKAKKAQVNIRLSTRTVAKLKEKATLEGIPYQTLIGSILHKYALGI